MAFPETSQVFLKYEQDPEFRTGINRLFEGIATPVEEFIVRNGVSIERWHQSIPIWVLNWTRPDNLQRIIQIETALEETDTPALTFIAYAYEDTTDQREFSKRTLIGYVDEVVLAENPVTTTKLLQSGFNNANNITTTEP